jgi:hypothetical protein
MNDVTRLTRAVAMQSDLKRAEMITDFKQQDGTNKVIDKAWFVKNAAIRAALPGMSLISQAGQFPVRTRATTLALPKFASRGGIGTAELKPLIPALMDDYKSVTGLNLRQKYQDHFTQQLGDTGEWRGKNFLQVMDEMASHFKGKEWQPFQDTFVPQLLRRDHANYKDWNVGSFGQQLENIIEGITPSELVNPIFNDIINAGIEANFLNPVAARAGQKEWFYSFNRSYADAYRYVKGDAPIYEYPEGGPATANAMARRGLTQLSMPLRYLGVAATEGQKWLFDSIIPRAKYTAFVETMYQEVYRRPELIDNPFAMKNMAQDVAASIDNRFGMLNYNNLLMDKTMKDMMFLYWRAPAWKLGTKREILGGMRDLAYFGALKTQRGFEKLGGVPKERRVSHYAEVDELSHRASYLFGMFGLGAYAAFFQYAMTGEFPSFSWNENDSAYNNFHSNMEKLWFPLSGDVEVGAFGVEPIRLSFPTYNKDVLNWFRDYGYGFVESFSHAMPPMIAPLTMAYTGQDWRGNSIYKASSDSVPEKAFDFAVEAIKGQFPFGIQQMHDRFFIDRAPLTTVLMEASIGVTKAPAGFIRSSAFEAGMDLIVSDLPEKAKPQYMAVLADAKRKVAARVRTGEKLTDNNIARLFKKELEEADLVSSPQQIIPLMRNVKALQTSLIAPVEATKGFFESVFRKATGYNQLHNVIGLMSPEEFTAYFGDNERSLHYRKMELSLKNFQGNNDYVSRSLESLLDLIDTKAPDYQVKGLRDLQDAEIADIRSAPISDKWRLALIRAKELRNVGQ